MRSRFWLCLLSFSVFTAFGCPAAAHPPRPSDPYTLEVQDEWGSPLRTYEHAGQLFVLGSYSQRYAIVIRNRTARRVEAVVSVDGRDVVSGKLGDFVRERGYVLGPYATLRIDGFRKSYEEVASFRFSTPEGSYSSRMGTPENVGVIGAAFFPERVRREPRPVMPQPMAAPEAEYRRRDAASSTGASRSAAKGESAAADRTVEAQTMLDDSYSAPAAAPSVNNLGTEYGETRSSHVEEVRFVRASSEKPAYVAVLHYDNAAGLTARGIDLEPRRYSSYRAPEPFPRNRFAPPPP
jgi:hypothetical protein